jgi:tRNA(Ile)-lysidine synthase
LPNGQKLKFKKVKGRGINLKFFSNQKLKIRNRQGGESFKPDSKRPTKKIKQLLQESDLPPWEGIFTFNFCRGRISFCSKFWNGY